MIQHKEYKIKNITIKFELGFANSNLSSQGKDSVERETVGVPFKGQL